jgi:hypothetical protein
MGIARQPQGIIGLHDTQISSSIGACTLGLILVKFVSIRVQMRYSEPT